MKNRRTLIIVVLLIAAGLYFFAPDVLGGILNTAGEVTQNIPQSAEKQEKAPETGLELLEPEQAAGSEAEKDTGKAESAPTPAQEAEPAVAIDENGSYTTKEDVALYIHTYGHLPSNFVTKKEAEAAGWSGGSLEKYLPGKCIGGSHYGNYEGLLPEAKGRKWTECDINTLGKKSRGAERIVFSNDGLIYYTADHYETFECLYE